MLQSVNDLKGYDIIATDGEIGSIEEFYFDDSSLVVRYLVANTGNWLTGKQNLISPQAITHLDREQRTIHVNLTKEQVTKSPGIDKHQPVSRQMEKLVSGYYGDRYYWDDTPEFKRRANSNRQMRRQLLLKPQLFLNRPSQLPLRPTFTCEVCRK